MTDLPAFLKQGNVTGFCIFCGESGSITTKTDAVAWMRTHVETCAKHPLAQARRERDTWKEAAEARAKAEAQLREVREYAEQFKWHEGDPPKAGDYFVKTSLDVYMVAWFQPQLGWDGDLRGTAEEPEVVTGWMHIPGEGHPAYSGVALSKNTSTSEPK